MIGYEYEHLIRKVPRKHFENKKRVILKDQKKEGKGISTMGKIDEKTIKKVKIDT